MTAKPQRPLTTEQLQIVRCQATRINVIAFAGTGKTTTLRAYAAARPGKRILYLAYNRVTANEARTTFGSHVDCLTSHALAFKSHGRKYATGKLREPRARDVMSTLGVQPLEAAWILATVSAYLHSDRPMLERSMVPGTTPQTACERILSAAEQFWTHMQDVNRHDVPMSHDGYLKLYALSQPDLSRRYDIILFDEAQDANPLTEALVRMQTRCTVVLVGDPHQAIYGFRGAMDALSRANGATVLPLTGSFRFGADIGLLNHVLLALYKGERRRLQGLAERTESCLVIDSGYPVTHVCRTNAKVFERAFRALGVRPVYFVGGTERYPFDKLVDVHRLACGQPPLDPFYATFSSIRELENYAKVVKDKESSNLVRLEAAYGDQIPHLVSRVKAEAVTRMEDASLILSTTHRAKGLEFRQVKVAHEDFETLVDENGLLCLPKDRMAAEEINLHYVAMTRATHVMVPSREYSQAALPMSREFMSLEQTLARNA